MKIVIIGLIPILVVIVEAAIHAYIIEKKKKDPKQNKAFTTMRTLFYISVVIGLTGPDYSWWALYWLGNVVATRWGLFDYALNIFRGKDIDHLGDITWDDKIEAQINSGILMAVKLLVVVGTTISGIIILERL